MRSAERWGRCSRTVPVLPTMTASETSAGNGHECDGSTESADTSAVTASRGGSAFEGWAREDLGVRLVGQVEEQEEIARRIRDGLRDGEDVSAEVQEFRQQESERLARLVGAARMASGGADESPARLGRSLEDAGDTVESLASEMGEALSEGEELRRRDVEKLRVWAFEVVRFSDRALGFCGGSDK